mgnify:CR=1 FL=1
MRFTVKKRLSTLSLNWKWTSIIQSTNMLRILSVIWSWWSMYLIFGWLSYSVSMKCFIISLVNSHTFCTFPAFSRSHGSMVFTMCILQRFSNSFLIVFKWPAKFLLFSIFSLSSCSAFLSLFKCASFRADAFWLDCWDFVRRWMFGPPLLAVRLLKFWLFIDKPWPCDPE